MEAFLFVVTIPTAEYEKYLMEALQRSTSLRLDDFLNASVYNECDTSKNISRISNKPTINNNDLLNLNGKNIDSDHLASNSNNIKIKLSDGSPVQVDEQNNDFLCPEGDVEKGSTRKTTQSVRKNLTKTSLRSYADEQQQNQSTPRRKKANQDDKDSTKNEAETSLEKVLEKTLANLNISAISWTSSTEGTHYHISFGVQGGAHCEKVLHELRACGIGSRADSTLSVLPCALHYSAPIDRVHRIGKTLEMKDSAWGTFVRSVRSRLTVAQVLEQVKAGAALTFDFFFLLIVAALTAALGLAENSTVFLVASMLISPLMGPIIAGTFGTAIQDRQLQKMGVIHELVGIFVTMGVGFVFGLIICGIDENYGNGEWPTLEITSRCDVRSLWVGALVALPSGAAVAISVLAGNTTSLVGVAISASLLPPAVNAGLLWAMSLVHLIFLNDDTRFTNIVKTSEYSDNPAIELAINGSISLLLTVVNIVCIFLGGILVMLIKNVAPFHSSYESDWQKNIKAVRDYNKNLDNEKHNDDLMSSDDDIMDSNKSDFDTVLQQAFAWEAFRVTQRDIMEHLKAQTNKHMTWSPAPASSMRPKVQDLYGVFRRMSEANTTKKSRLVTPLNPSQNYSRIHDESFGSARKTEKSDLNTAQKQKPKFTIVPVEESTLNTIKD